jgi:TRAP-type C4-dicarboxylate transport system permease small subunit
MIFRRVLVIIIVLALLVGGVAVWRRISQLSDDALALGIGVLLASALPVSFLLTIAGYIFYYLRRQRNEERERQHQRAIEREQPQVIVVQTPQKEIRRW